MSVSKLNRILRLTNTFHVILCVILFHSFVSIFLIYIHLSWFFSDERKPWPKESLHNEVITWNVHSKLNVLSSHVISSDQLSTTGWWMEHSRWDNHITCFAHKWKLCSQAFSTSCKSDGIRAIYQYVVFEKKSQVHRLDLSLTATADQLDPQVIGASFGAMALIKLDDGNTENIQIQFSSNIDSFTTRKSSFTTDTSSIYSVLLMLICFGYSGSVHFTDLLLTPHISSSLAEDFLAPPCSFKIPTSKTSSLIAMTEEDILVPKNQSLMESSNLVTLVTQVSMDRLSTLERSLQSWEGPISLVIYIVSKHEEKSQYEWQRLYIQKKLKNMKLSSSSHVTLVFGSSARDFPINILRNIAMRHAHSKFMFLLDADFQPSPDFERKFLDSLKYVSLESRTVFVVPAFQYMESPQKGDNAPQTKEELLQLLHREDPFIIPFRIVESSESHKVTDYWKWYRADKPYVLGSFCDKYEPYILTHKTKAFPEYDERFLGYGMNKVTHITQLFASNYSFVVLPDLWVLHLPHKISTFAHEFLQIPHHRLQNRLQRFEFVSNLLNQYAGCSYCKCIL